MSNPKSIPGYKRTLHSFPVLYQGWEADDEGWVVELKSGAVVLVLTGHCHPYIAEPTEVQEKIAEYEAAIAASREALRMVDAIAMEAATAGETPKDGSTRSATARAACGIAQPSSGETKP